MNLDLMKVNVRQFNDDEDFSSYVVDGELDVDRIINDYSTSLQGNENEENVDEVDETPETPDSETPEVPESADDPEETPVSGGEEETPEPEDAEPQKRTPDQAFAQMRRQVEAYEPLAKWVQDLAAQQGFQDPQELIDAYQQRRMEREAKEKGVPVDVYQRLYQLEQENQAQKESLQAQQFNQEVEATKAKYNLSDEQLTSVFQFMGQRGYNAGDIPFEDAYILANRDNLLQEAEHRGRQDYLEEKRKQQKGATPQPGTGAEDKPSGNDLDYSTDAILKQFENLGIPID